MPATPARDPHPDLTARATTAGLRVRGYAAGRATTTVTLQGPSVPSLTDADLTQVAGVTTSHFGASVSRWPGTPDVATVYLHND